MKKYFFCFLATSLLFSSLLADQQNRNPYNDYTQFYIDKINREDGEIVIKFNIPVNPESVTTKSILINNMPLSEEIKFLFNRNADKLVIYEDSSWQDMTLKIEVKGLISYNNILMENFLAITLKPDDKYERDN